MQCLLVNYEKLQYYDIIEISIHINKVNTEFSLYTQPILRS